MLKRTVPFLLALAVVLVVASPARADYCVRCSFVQPWHCVWGAVLGRYDCDDTNGMCETFGETCHDQTTVAALSSEYQVASVERIDDAPAPDATLIAQLEAPQSPAPAQR